MSQELPQAFCVFQSIPLANHKQFLYSIGQAQDSLFLFEDAESTCKVVAQVNRCYIVNCSESEISHQLES